MQQSWTTDGTKKSCSNALFLVLFLYWLRLVRSAARSFRPLGPPRWRHYYIHLFIFVETGATPTSPIFRSLISNAQYKESSYFAFEEKNIEEVCTKRADNYSLYIRVLRSYVQLKFYLNTFVKDFYLTWRVTQLNRLCLFNVEIRAGIRVVFQVVRVSFL